MSGKDGSKWDDGNSVTSWGFEVADIKKECSGTGLPRVGLVRKQKKRCPSGSNTHAVPIAPPNLEQLTLNGCQNQTALVSSGTLTQTCQVKRLRGGAFYGNDDGNYICPPCTCRPRSQYKPESCCLPPQHPCFRSPCYVPDCSPYRSAAPCVKGCLCNLRTPSSPWIPCNPCLPFNPSNPCFGCDIYEPCELPCPCPPPPCCPRLIKPSKPPRKPSRPCSTCSPCCGWATTCGPWYRYGPCGPFGPVGPYGPCGPFGPGVPGDPGNFLPGDMPSPPPEPEPPRDTGDSWPPIPPSPCPSMEGTRPPVCPDPPCPSPPQPCQRQCVSRRPCSPPPPCLPYNFPVSE